MIKLQLWPFYAVSKRNQLQILDIFVPEIIFKVQYIFFICWFGSLAYLLVFYGSFF